jgi:peroxiredoxin-like protein
MNSEVFETSTEWLGARSGKLQTPGPLPLEINAPVQFKGQAGYWTPETLFVAAAETCLMQTFLAVAEHSKLAVSSYRSSAQGKLEKTPGGLKFTEIVIGVTIEVAPGTDRELAQRVLEKAKRSCLVANSLQTLVRVEPRFV